MSVSEGLREGNMSVSEGWEGRMSVSEGGKGI